jgi:prolyl-tRNA editing enzyme YbaK/EbsC (Cys-tRNA(Pro) deacylase)
MDRDLIGFDEVWAAAGTPDAVFRIAPDALREAAGAEVMDLRE